MSSYPNRTSDSFITGDWEGTWEEGRAEANVDSLLRKKNLYQKIEGEKKHYLYGRGGRGWGQGATVSN